MLPSAFVDLLFAKEEQQVILQTIEVVSYVVVLARYSSCLLTGASYRLAPADVPASTTSRRPILSVYSRLRQGSFLARRQTRSLLCSIPPRSLSGQLPISQGLVVGLSETSFTSFGSRQRFLKICYRRLV